MKIGIVAPSPVPFSVGGAEKLWWGLQEEINQETPHQAELIKLPGPESGFHELIDSYRRFSELDLSGFDLVISGKYPAWMVQHPNHVCYLQHKLRGLYDTWSLVGTPIEEFNDEAAVAAILRFMQEHAQQRECLPDFFGLLDRVGDTLSRDALAFPGPLIREIVHFLDAIGLYPGGIRRYCAISQNVTTRANYFPPGETVHVVHHPSDLKRFRCGESNYLLTVGRLDDAKRVSLIVNAMRHVTAEVALKIAGTGPLADELEASTADDPRVEWLGFVNDGDLERLYADACAVLYTPFDEDYGLVPFEAMSCGKPVIVTSDSGGPLELVEDGVTGRVVDPDPVALARAIDALCSEPAEARAMGARGRLRAEKIQWPEVVATLLAEDRPRRRVAGSPRRRISIATTFPIFPPRGGGQTRVFHLYRQLARSIDVEVVSFADNGAPFFEGVIAPGMREIRVPKSAGHANAEAELSERLGWRAITDVAMPRLFHHSPEYLEALRRSTRGADVVVASHPYLQPAIRAVCDAPLWYEAHNVEVALKRSLLPDDDLGRELFESTRNVERECCEEAELVMLCSAEDEEELSRLYGSIRGRTAIVPNGVDLDAITYVSLERREQQKASLGLGSTFTALFVGSWHPPNIEAVYGILGIAPKLPDVRFLILGGVCDALDLVDRPDNVGFMGVVDEETKSLVMNLSDIALNPMLSGGGTNLKMLEYCAAGIPVLTTPHGARGLQLDDGRHLEVAPLEEFTDRIGMALRREDAAAREQRSLRARRQVEQIYGWEHIGNELLRVIDEL